MQIEVIKTASFDIGTFMLLVKALNWTKISAFQSIADKTGCQRPI